jgi:hypothetical protein
MITVLAEMVAAEHRADLRRAAEQSARASVGQRDRLRVELRRARREDADVVRRLAALDDARPLMGAVLLALVDGDAVAALSLHDGRVVADPFVATTESVSLLRVRAGQLGGARARRRLRWRRPRLRLA